MPGPGTLVRFLTASLLRNRLRIVTVALLLTSAALVLIDLAGGKAFSPILQILFLLLLGCITALLLSRTSIALKPLRVMELFLFGSTAAYFAVWDYSLIYESASMGNSGLLLSGLIKMVLHFIVLVAIYGILIPNTWQRATAVVIPLAVTPLAVVVFLLAWQPQITEAMADISSERVADVGLLLIVSAVVVIAGTQIGDRYRSQELESQAMGFYRLSERIGSGAMGEVWLAEHHKLVRPAVIKLIRPETLKEADSNATQRILRRFEKEVQATAALRSPHTVEVYDYGVANNGVFYYVMEYLDGLDLATLVEKHGTVSPARTVHLLRQICESLAEAHDNHLIHRDVKPSNVFVCHMGVSYDFIKVLDFGLVKTEKRTDGDSDTLLTLEGTTTGTPAFMAPELATGEGDVDGRADIYALGCVGYWLLTGQLVFQQESAVAMIADHLKEMPVAPSQGTESEVPEKLDQVILKCLEKDPTERFQNAMELANALDACMEVSSWDHAHAEHWWNLHYPRS